MGKHMDQVYKRMVNAMLAVREIDKGGRVEFTCCDENHKRDIIAIFSEVYGQIPDNLSIKHIGEKE